MKKKLKISEDNFRIYLLNHYVDECGGKISDRVLWSREEFYEYTGLYNFNKYTYEKIPVSTGTISYWKSKLNICEEDIFNYHKIITKRIDNNVSFEDWSRKNNKGYKKNIKTYNRDTIKRNLIKYAGLPKKYEYMSFDNISNVVLRLWKNLGLDEQEEMKKFYEKVV